jgi:Kef-type K+ transport system membrane component KefB
VTTNQVLLGVGLIVALAVGSQVLASRLRIPAIIILLPVGFTAGAITTDVNPQRLLGPAFQRYASGARICAQPADGGAPPDGDVLFLVRADGRLAPVTQSGPPQPEAGDTMILLAPAAVDS